MTKWISVIERLPEKDGRYIICTPRYNWIGVSSLRQGIFDDETATHWMNLPLAPEQDN